MLNVTISSVFPRSGNSRIKRQLVSLSNQLSGSPQTVQGFSTSLRQFDVSNLVSPVAIVDQCRLAITVFPSTFQDCAESTWLMFCRA